MTRAAEQVRARLGDRLAPEVAIVLGSGLGPLADEVADRVAIDYAELDGFPVSTVRGHAGRLVLGSLGGRRVAVMQGRAHLYEGHDVAALRVPIRTLRALGAETLLVTNAAGSLDVEVGPGRLMALTDHINMMGTNPLIGPNDDRVGPRFLPVADAYDPELLAVLLRAAEREAIALARGVYLAVTGPSFETPAEIRAFGVLGADAVGMSTVPEVLIARHCGLRVAAVSAITNLAEGLGEEPLTHDGTLAAAARAGEDLRRLVLAALPEL